MVSNTIVVSNILIISPTRSQMTTCLQDFTEVLSLVDERGPVEEMDDAGVVAGHVGQELLDVLAPLDALGLEGVAEGGLVDLALDDHALLAGDLGVVSPGLLQALGQPDLVNKQSPSPPPG